MGEVTGLRRRPRAGATVAALVCGLLVAGCSPAPQRSSAPTGVTVSRALPAPAPATSPSPAGRVTAGAPAAPSAAAVPEVLGLSWLDGISTAPALRMSIDGVLHWQGDGPDDRAVLHPDGSFDWAGLDGSLVGCAGPAASGPGRLRCVGIDAAGDLAVTTDLHGPRLVYAPGGGLIGRFAESGIQLAGPARSDTLAQSLANSHVDLAALTDFATEATAFAGGVTGDPHVVTRGGARVTQQQIGTFVARSDPDHEIEFRTRVMPYQSDVSYVTDAVIGTQGRRVELSLTGRLLVDGAQVKDVGSFRQMPLSAGAQVGYWPADAGGVVHVVVLWADGGTVSMVADPSLGLTVVAMLGQSASAGVFGTAAAVRAGPGVPPGPPTVAAHEVGDGQAQPTAGRRGGDFLARPAVPATSPEQVVNSWRVRPGESLFADAGPDGPGTVGAGPDGSGSATVSAAPSAGPAAPVSPMATLAAQQVCGAAQFAVPDDAAACVFDVARTGDGGYVPDHAELATAATRVPIPASFAAGWPAAQLGPVVSALPVLPDAQVSASVPSGARQVYRMVVAAGRAVGVDAGSCGQRAGSPIRGGPAFRLFDDGGRPVTDSGSSCGRRDSAALAAGTYYLVLAGASTGPDTSFRLRLIKL